MDTPAEFSFAGFAPEFDRHITASIRGYDNLRTDCIGFSQHFIQKNSVVFDIGCSSGELLRSIRDYNQKRYPSVKYFGIDVEGEFKEQRFQRRASNIQFKKIDIGKYDGFKNLSIVYSLFTMQFLPEGDRLTLVKNDIQGSE
jgi:tRNA (cmo5U34)-methyltransferase